MSTVICSKCKGFKRLLGMGMLERDCDRCTGKGRILAEQSTENTSDIKLRDDLRTLSDAYTDTQTENKKLKEQIALLSAKPDKKNKSISKSK